MASAQGKQGADWMRREGRRRLRQRLLVVMVTAARPKPREPPPSTGRGSGPEPRDSSPSIGGTRDSQSRSAVPGRGSGGTLPCLDRRRTPESAPASPPVSFQYKDASKPGIWGVAAAQFLLWLQPRSSFPLTLQNDQWHSTILIKTPEISSQRIKHPDKTQAQTRAQKSSFKEVSFKLKEL